MSEQPIAEKDTGLRTWLREWWVTLRYGSRLTRAGRTLRRNLRDDLSEYVEVERPTRCPRHGRTSVTPPVDPYDNHDRRILEDADAGRVDARIVVVRCPHRIGLAYQGAPAAGMEDDWLMRLPCPCNDRSEVVATVEPTRPFRPKGP